MERINEFRRVACDRLEVLLNQESATKPIDADLWLDASIRDLAGQPKRIPTKPAYVGLFGDSKDLDDYRDLAVDRLYVLLCQLKTIDNTDEELDGVIRLLSDLPKRPGDVAPYVRLFVLKDDTAPPVRMQPASIPVAASKAIITIDQLVQIVGNAKYRDRITALYPGLLETCDRFSINTPLRLAHFLAQILHESGSFKWLKEIWMPTDAQSRYEPPSKLAKVLGNTQRGDGFRYMGRGVIQLTGRANYAQFSKAMGIDFVANPQLVEDPKYAVAVAGWFWDSRNLNNFADADNIRAVTRRINGGYNGLPERQKYLMKAKQVLMQR